MNNLLMNLMRWSYSSLGPVYIMPLETITYSEKEWAAHPESSLKDSGRVHWFSSKIISIEPSVPFLTITVNVDS